VDDRRRQEVQRLVEEAAADRARLADPAVKDAVREAIAALDRGALRVAEKRDGVWQVNVWVKQAVLLYFAVAEMQAMQAGPLHFFDKIPPKTDVAASGVRVVPPGTIRYGAYVEPGAIVMPAFVNIGAWVGAGTMVDTWATVGSCAQIGRHVHLSGGVGIGGVLEPAGAVPVVVEDGCFIGSRCIVVEGVRVEEEAVLAANVTLTASTPIIDVTGPEEVVTKGRIPPRAVVVPGVRAKAFPAGTYHLAAAFIIGRRSASTDKKTSLTQALRDFELSV
jgi:2,3,4,5-tetrahydropyridine-2-carboxylate N-succinyltransferase